MKRFPIFFFFLLFFLGKYLLGDIVLAKEKRKKRLILSNKRKQDYIGMYVSKTQALLTSVLYHCVKFLLTCLLRWPKEKSKAEWHQVVSTSQAYYKACSIFSLSIFSSLKDLCKTQYSFS